MEEQRHTEFIKDELREREKRPAVTLNDSISQLLLTTSKHFLQMEIHFLFEMVSFTISCCMSHICRFLLYHTEAKGPFTVSHREASCVSFTTSKHKIHQLILTHTFKLIWQKYWVEPP